MNYQRQNILFLLLFVFTFTFAVGQSTEVKSIIEIEQEKNQSKTIDVTGREKIDEIVKPRITKVQLNATTSEILIENAAVHQKFLNKEFRDHITSLFGVDHLVVSMSESIIKLTLLNSEIERILIEKLGLTTIQLSHL